MFWMSPKSNVTILHVLCHVMSWDVTCRMSSDSSLLTLISHCETGHVQQCHSHASRPLCISRTSPIHRAPAYLSLCLFPLNFKPSFSYHRLPETHVIAWLALLYFIVPLRQVLVLQTCNSKKLSLRLLVTEGRSHLIISPKSESLFGVTLA